jgi:hypothetical protein
MSKTLGTIFSDGHKCVIHEDDDGRVHFTADADIDADGANGQFGARAAYMADDSGSDFLANGGMAIVNGKVICAKPWARDVVILGDDNQPKVFANGVIASMTWYRHRDKARDDPSSYIDSETVPYVVVPPLIVQKTKGVVRGCRAQVSYNGKSVECVVADKSGKTSIGEISIAAARALGINPSPRNGGLGNPIVHYEIWPGQAAPGFELQPS